MPRTLSFVKLFIGVAHMFKKKSVSSIYNKDVKRERILNIVLILLLVLAIILVIWLLFFRNNNHNQDGQVDNQAVIGQLDGKSKEEIQKELDRKVKESSLVVSINTKVVMQNGKSKANIKIENVPNNHYSFKVKILLKNSGSVIYESGYIKPNYHIQSSYLKKDLSKGTHKAVAIFYAYSLKDNKLIGQQKVFVDFIVKG